MIILGILPIKEIQRVINMEEENENNNEIRTYTDLKVYQKLCDLHLDISDISLDFPKFELFELGSQIRRPSNSIPANIAEGGNNKHINIYLEGINRALGELRETLHHLYIAHKKEYFNYKQYSTLRNRYNECGRMLKGLERSLNNRKLKTTNDPLTTS
jgi:four helix bundle protein